MLQQHIFKKNEFERKVEEGKTPRKKDVDQFLEEEDPTSVKDFVDQATASLK